MPSHIGLSTRDQAQVDANRIMDYWGRRGYEVTAYPVPVRTTVQGEGESVDTLSGWSVRSNLVNGCPPLLLEQKRRSLLG